MLDRFLDQKYWLPQITLDCIRGEFIANPINLDLTELGIANATVNCVGVDDEIRMSQITEMLNMAAGGLLPRTIADIRGYAERGLVFTVEGSVGPGCSPQTIFTFSIEPGQVTRIGELTQPLTIFERGAMAVHPQLQGTGLARKLLIDVYSNVPQLADLMILITSLNPAVWFNNLTTGLVPVKVDEFDPHLQDMITWTCVCKENITNDIPLNSNSQDVNTNPNLSICHKRPRIGQSLVYPFNAEGRFRGGSDVIFLSRELFELLQQGLHMNIEDATAELFGLLTINAHNESNRQRLAELANLLSAQGYNLE